MDAPTAGNVLKDLAVAGYLVQLVDKGGGVLNVRAWSKDGVPVSVSTIASFATAHGVTGYTDTAVFE